MGHTCGAPNEIELTTAHGLFYCSFAGRHRTHAEPCQRVHQGGGHRAPPHPVEARHRGPRGQAQGCVHRPLTPQTTRLCLSTRTFLLPSLSLCPSSLPPSLPLSHTDTVPCARASEETARFIRNTIGWIGRIALHHVGLYYHHNERIPVSGGVPVAPTKSAREGANANEYP